MKKLFLGEHSLIIEVGKKPTVLNTNVVTGK